MEAEAAGRAAAGIYPVDILEDDPAGHREAALAYRATLGEGAWPSPEVFSLPTGEQVKLEASSVCFCTVHCDEPQHKILVLVNPQDTKTVVAVYMKESWWTTEDVLRTSDPAREGLMKVQSFGERIVLFILNVVIFGRLERNLDDDDMFFLPHSVKEEAKILWRDGAAVGFYTTKRKGSLCGDGTGVCYLLPVLDTVFVRRSHRRQGLGLTMLRDFCQTFREDEALGISWPISPAMYQAHPGNSKEEVTALGCTSQDGGPGISHNGEDNKERISGEEVEKNDQDCAVTEAAGWLARACWAEQEGKEAKRTAVDAGLPPGSWRKHMRPSS
ncbi:protein FAM169BP isoform X4 [Tursiops truncatus]|uniref:Protein FAM169B isoform X2 n=1 Tax=Tursiops truncatus TaxID=9739 RepID=A0A6J3R0D9_TURTR|nr:protein FAM169B isoform X2 [Tursiops truncatus]